VYPPFPIFIISLGAESDVITLFHAAEAGNNFLFLKKSPIASSYILVYRTELERIKKKLSALFV
jgi:hypothetical protein